MTQEEIQLMTQAYSQLLQIEMHLRSVIKERMTAEYGIHWHTVLSKRVKNATIRKDFDKLEYYQVVSYFYVLPSLSSIYPIRFKNQIRSLGDIRNKIAHHKLLTEGEYNRLNEVYKKLCFSLEVVK